MPAAPIAPPAEAAPEEDDEGRKSDPELLVMGRTLKLLKGLDEAARSRVVRWLGDRFASDADA